MKNPTTPQTRPIRPARYSLPPLLTLEPRKLPMRKPFWYLRTDRVGGGHYKNKAEAFAQLQRRLEKVGYTDQLMYAELYNHHGLILHYPHHYKLDADGKTYTSTTDRHEWHEADEVNMLFWLAHNMEKAA